MTNTQNTQISQILKIRQICQIPKYAQYTDYAKYKKYAKFAQNVTNAKYVETLYVNVLGRDYDQEGYNYWLGNLNSGFETRYELLLGFAENAENLALFTEMTVFG